MDHVLTDSNTELNGPVFDISKCVGKFNYDGSVSLTLVWTPVLLATSYKLIQGGRSPIVLNSIYFNTFIDQTGCFESGGPTKKTKELKEYITTDTSYIITYPATILQALNKVNSSFLVYSYFGKRRGPIPYSVALIDILNVNCSVIGFNEIYMRIKPNISVRIVEKEGQLIMKSNKYEYFNHYTKKKYIKIPNIDDVKSGAEDNNGVLESAVLLFQPPIEPLPSAEPPIPSIVISDSVARIVIVSCDFAGITGSNLIFSFVYGTSEPLLNSVEAYLVDGTTYQSNLTLLGQTTYFFKSVVSNRGGSKSSIAGTFAFK